MSKGGCPSFVDYTTKPNMTCAPLLGHMADGMKHLEATMREEDARDRLESLLQQGLADGRHLTGDSPQTAQSAGLPEGEPVRKPLRKDQDEARRRLIRLWTSANQALLKGCCLMAIQLLTRR